MDQNQRPSGDTSGSNRKLPQDSVEKAIEDARERLRVHELDDAELRAQMMAAQKHNPVTGFMHDVEGAIVLREEFNRRRKLPSNTIRIEVEAPWDQTTILSSAKLDLDTGIISDISQYAAVDEDENPHLLTFNAAFVGGCQYDVEQDLDGACRLGAESLLLLQQRLKEQRKLPEQAPTKVLLSTQLAQLFDKVADLKQSVSTEGIESGLAVVETQALQDLFVEVNALKAIRQQLMIGRHSHRHGESTYLFLVPKGVEFGVELFEANLQEDFEPEDGEELSVELMDTPSLITVEQDLTPSSTPSLGM